MVILFMQLAHNVLIWAREGLAPPEPSLHTDGIVRLIREGWAIAGRIKVTEQGVLRVRLRQAHPRARDVCKGCLPLLANSHIGIGVGCSSPAAVLGQILAAGWMFSATC